MARRYHIARIYRRSSPEPEPLRIALVLSGAVALGAFEAGVVYEVLQAVRKGAPLTLDMVVGSSAGALVGATTVKSLVMGAPFEHAMLQWTEFTLQQLTAVYRSSDEARLREEPADRGILSSEAVRRILEEHLVRDPVQRTFQPAYPAPRVLLLMTMSNLDGLPGTGMPLDENRFSEAVIFRFAPPLPHRLSQSPYPPAFWRRVGKVCRASAAFPGAFDPEHIAWIERIQIPGLLDEIWENETLLKRLHEADPTLQPRMRYSDGGILDEQPVERAIAALPLITGGKGEAGGESLVYDSRRCFLFIEPDPPATSLDALKAGTPQSWFAAFARALRLWTLSASPHTSQKRVLVTNKRQEKLLQFLADLARRMREDGPAAPAAQAVGGFRLAYPEVEALRRFDLAGGGLGEPTGLIDPKLYRQAVQQFYRWLADEQRFQRDMAWLDRLPPGRIRDVHRGVRAAIRELREAYLALEGIDPVTPGYYQAVLEEVHASLAESLGLSQPWVALHEVTPEDPKQMLKGEEIIHFGGFFSQEFLKHDFDVGRYYAYLWLKEALPDYVPDEEPEQPPITGDGLDWKVLWQNRLPLWRIAGRFTRVVLEMLGLAYAGAGQLLVRLMAWSFLLSVIHGILLIMGSWLGWITFAPQYQEYQFWLLLGTSLFPLTFGLILGLIVRGGSGRSNARRRSTRHR